MSDILSIVAILISLFTLIWTIIVHMRSNYAGIELSLNSREGLNYEDRSFIPWKKFTLEIKNRSNRPSAITDVYWFRDGHGYEGDAVKQPLTIGAWNTVRCEISPPDSSPPPRYLIVEDMDNKFYVLDFLSNSGDLVSPQRTGKFKDKRRMEIYMGWSK